MVSHHASATSSIISPATAPGFVVSEVMPVTQEITVHVSDEMAEMFEAHAHLLAPARIIGKDPEANPFWLTYTLDWPGAPAGAASVVPIWQGTYQDDQVTVQLQGLDWYDAHGRALPAPTSHATAD